MTEHQKKYGELDPGETVEAWHFFTARGRTWQGNLPVQVDEGFDAICVHLDGVLGVVECELDRFSWFSFSSSE